MTTKTGILLVNLGTPAAPTTAAVKAFLSQFLHDQRVVDLPRYLWCPLLHFIILPTRSPKVAKLYQQVWTEQGSPLMVISQQQRAALEHELKREGVEVPVALAKSQDALYKFLLNKWYFDELYDRIFVRPALWIGRVLWKVGDGRIIDGCGPDGVS